MKCTAWVTMLRNHTWFTGGLRKNSIRIIKQFAYIQIITTTLVALFSLPLLVRAIYPSDIYSSVRDYINNDYRI